MSLMVGTLIACTSNTKNKNEGVSEKTEQEVVKENTNEIVYTIPNDSWELSSTFQHSIVDNDGKEVSYTIVGNEETLGFTGDILMDVEKSHKIFWFYFGKENIFDKPVEVKAVKKGTEELVDLYSGMFYQGAEVSADSANMPSNLKFPSAGIWKILVYINHKFYESIVVRVN